MATIAHRGVAGEETDARRGEETDRPAAPEAQAALRLSLQDRLLGLRDRILANQDFQRLAAALLNAVEG